MKISKILFVVKFDNKDGIYIYVCIYVCVCVKFQIELKEKNLQLRLWASKNEQNLKQNRPH